MDNVTTTTTDYVLLVFNETTTTERTEEEIDWVWRWYLNVGFLGISIFWLGISLFTNLANIFGILCSGNLRRNGYYHVLILFEVFHILYFVIHVCHLFVGGKIINDVYLKSEIYFDYDWINKLPPQFTFDLENCFLGTELLLLAILTVDCFIKGFRRQGASSTRSILSLITIFIWLLSVTIVIIRYIFPELVPITDLFDYYVYIIHGIFLVLYIVVSAFVIVIVGTVNWVRDINSSYPLSIARRRMNALDHGFTIINSVLMLLLMIKLIVNLAIFTDVFSVKYSNIPVTLAFHFLYEIPVFVFALYPILISVKIFRHCCSNDIYK